MATLRTNDRRMLGARKLAGSHHSVMRLLLVLLVVVLPPMSTLGLGQDRNVGTEDEFVELLERLRKEDTAVYDKVVRLADENRPAALQFLRDRFADNASKPDANKNKRVQKTGVQNRQGACSAAAGPHRAVHENPNDQRGQVLDRLVSPRGWSVRTR